MKKKFDRVNCNLLQAEIYARNNEMCAPCPHNYKNRTYVELRNIQKGATTMQERVLVPYPITPESVKSYASSCDYRNDIAGNMNLPPRGKNLGDITQVQDILKKDLESARAVYLDLQNKYSQAAAQIAQAKQNSQAAVKEETTNG